MSQDRVVHRVRQKHVWANMRASFTNRYLGRLAQQHLQDGHPQMAVFAFDHVGRAITLWGRYELGELKLLMDSLGHRLAPGGVCLDVGANIGNHSVFFASYFAQVFAFEPNPRAFSLLQFNTQLRPHIQCLNYGLSKKARQATLSVPPSNIGMASLCKGAPVLGEMSVECELRTLDSIEVWGNKRVALLKIDVEGHEHDVLQGAIKMLRRDRPVVVFEQDAKDFERGSSPAIELLRQCGYKTFWTVERYPATGWRIVDLVLRLTGDDGWRIVERDKFEAKFYSMIVALAIE